MKFETNKEVHSRDYGEITLYVRGDQTSGKYYARIKVDGSKGYVKFATKKTNPLEALFVADKRYKELLVLQNRTGDIHQKTFNHVMKEWVSHELKSGDNNQKKINDYVEKLDRYAVPYFRKFSGVSEVEEKHLREWVDYRRTNYRRSPPADNTIVRELAGIKLVFEYAYQRNLIPSRLRFPRVSVKPNPRPALTFDEYQKLYKGLRKWVKDEEKRRRQYRSRFYVQHFILIGVNTGLRKGEIRNLLWGDVQRRKTGSGIVLIVSNKGKRKQSRRVIPRDSTERYLNRLKDFRAEELGLSHRDDVPINEPIFCSIDGNPVVDYKKGFASAMRYVGLEKDRDGNPFTIYSLRHTYATFRLINNASLYNIAENMGTSVEMLTKYYSHLITEAVADDINRDVVRI